MEAQINSIREAETVADKIRIASELSDEDFVVILYARSINGDDIAARMLLEYSDASSGGDADA